MRVLILGGTRFLGRHLAEEAARRGHEVTLFNRGKSGPDLFAEMERLRGDRKEDLGLLEGREWDLVIDTCGYHPREVGASARLLAGACSHYTFVSSINVYPDMSPPAWQKHDPDDDGLADPVLTAQDPWEADTVRDPTLAVYAESGLPYQNPDGEYLLYYTGGSSSGDPAALYQTGLATSTNLISWTHHIANPVLPHGPEGAWDHEKVCPGSVLVMPDGTFRMYYSATGGGAWGANYRVGLATSDDGVTW